MSFDSMLDQTVQIERPKQDSDGSGSYTNDEDSGFRPDRVDVPAKISDMSHLEEKKAGQLASDITHIMSLRAQGVGNKPGFTRQHRVIDRFGNIYEIMNVIPVIQPTHHVKAFLKLVTVGEGIVYGD